MRKKGLITLLTLCITASMLSGCTTKESGNSVTKENTEISSNNDTYESSIQVGAIIKFGTYEQDGNISNGAEPIEWRVLAIEDNKALVISKYVLDWKQYHEVSEKISWSNCGLRTWLNEDFYSQAFNTDEKGKIEATTITTKDDSSENQVFILNKSELEKYFYSDDDRICEPTEATKDSAKNTSNTTFENGEGCWYWGCGKGTYDFAPYVSKGGQLGNNTSDKTDYVERYYGVRPAMWIEIGN